MIAITVGSQCMHRTVLTLFLSLFPPYSSPLPSFLHPLPFFKRAVSLFSIIFYLCFGFLMQYLCLCVWFISLDIVVSIFLQMSQALRTYQKLWKS